MNLSYFKQRRQLPAQMQDTLWPHTDTETDTDTRLESGEDPQRQLVSCFDWSSRFFDGQVEVEVEAEAGVGFLHAFWIATQAQLYRKTIHNYRAATYFEVNTFVAMAFGN